VPEHLPPRPPGGFRRPGPGNPGPYRDALPIEEGPPPWADLPPVRPARPGPSRPRPGAGYPVGSWQTPAPSAPGSAGRHAEEPVPEWAGPDAVLIDGGLIDGGPVKAEPIEGGPEDDVPRARPRPPGGRAMRAAARRRRRWLIMTAGLVVVAGGVTAALVVPGGPAPAPVVPGGLITTFQSGELQTVPAACGTVPAATVQQYLPGQVKQASPLAIDGAASSACDWTIDRAPVYRLLELNLLAYAPNGLASGDGSATYAAMDAYRQTLQNLQDPPPHSAEPRATVAALSGLGDEAFSATQVFRRGGAVTDVATVVVRYHNVVVTATLNGLEHSNQGSYGPVSLSGLSAAALAFAQAAETALRA
jgi:hypothetical protein